MIRLGVVILAHDHLDRAAHLARIWLEAGCAVHLHVDAKVPVEDLAPVQALGRRWPAMFALSHEVRCEWGRWSIVRATLHATERLLARHPEVTHVLLCSGACLPLRPIQELTDHLARRPDTDFIESTRAADLPPGALGLTEERTSHWFPWPWRHRRLFDATVRLHRRLGLRRRPPRGVTPHIGSQWWCLTRRTLEGILTDPLRRRAERFYRHSWIPDEGFFQTMARRWSRDIAGQGLTLAIFDDQGKPRVFYDDHAPILARSGAFVARKIWPGAQVLYRRFPQPGGVVLPDAARVTGALAPRLASPGIMQGRFRAHDLGMDRPLHLICGASWLFRGFGTWAKAGGVEVGGRLLAPGVPPPPWTQSTIQQRDADPMSFLRNTITRGGLSGFLFEVEDHGPLGSVLPRLPEVQVHVIAGAWLAARPDPVTAAAWQRAELSWIEDLRRHGTRHAVWRLSDCLLDPARVLTELGTRLGVDPAVPLPDMRPLPGLDHTLDGLRRAGVSDRLFGPIPRSTLRPPEALRRVVGG